MPDRTPDSLLQDRRIWGAVALLLALLFVVTACLATRDAAEPGGAEGDPMSQPAGDNQPILDVEGLTHFYPLTTDAKDVKGNQDGEVYGVTFDGSAQFAAQGINVGDSDDFSAASHPLTVAATLDVENWNQGSDEYVNWLGKGVRDAQEWTFRYYVDGTDRERRVSFYAFNADGGLGTGSYCSGENGANDGPHTFVGVIDGGTISIYRDGVMCDSDPLTNFDVTPEDTDSPVWFGTRGDGTGHLVGSLRDVAFFDRALTPQEIAALP